MKALLPILLLFGFASAPAQNAEPRFRVELGTDSVLMGNVFEVRFILENAQGSRFTPPPFTDFHIRSGPNHSTSIQIVNGRMSQQQSYTYLLEPTAPGSFWIVPASIEVDGQILETEPIEVFVWPNPEGIVRPPKPRNGLESFPFPFFDENLWKNPLWENIFPPLDSLLPKIDSLPSAPPKRKKRKTIRI